MSRNLPRHLLELAVRPALEALGPRYATVAAEQMVMGTAAVETGFDALRQIGRGPALGFWQMEPATFFDIRDRFLRARLDLRAAALVSASSDLPEPDELAWNLRLGAVFCRLRYLMDPLALPEAGNVASLAATWKRVYNTHLGAGKPEHFERAWAQHCAGLWPEGERV